MRQFDKELFKINEFRETPQSYSNLFDSSLFSVNDIYILFENLAKSPNKQRHARLFKNSGMNMEFLYTFFDNIKKYGGAYAHNWLGEESKTNEIGLVLNYSEKFNDSLLQKIAYFFEPYIDHYGIPSGGFELDVFMGNYKYTPFGVHQDLYQGTTFHFNIGDDIKEMWLWSPEKYRSITNKVENSYDFDTLDQAATKCKILPGDFFVLPENLYHVGKTHGLTTTVSVSSLLKQNQNLFTRLINSILYKEEGVEDVSQLTIDNLEVNKVLDMVQSEAKNKFNLTESLEMNLIDYKFTLKSNAGFTTTPPLIPQAELAVLKKDTQLRRTLPFKIYYHIRENLTVYARGHRVEIPYSVGLVNMIDAINNSKESWTPAELLKGESTADTLLKYLIQFRAVTFA